MGQVNEIFAQVDERRQVAYSFNSIHLFTGYIQGRKSFD